MADDPGAAPPPRPRRRRTDWDPNAKVPKVAYERRRSRRAAEAPAPASPESTPDAPAAAAIAAAGAASVEPAPEVAADGTASAAAPEVPVDDTAGDVAAAGAIATVATTTPAGGPWLPLLDARSPNAWVCPFLRSVGTDDSLALPIEAADAGNRCAALAEPVPQSLRQQELVCLTTSHVNCPRYLRGAATVAEVPVPPVRAGRVLTPAIAGSLVILVLAFTASLAFVMSRGSLELAAAASATPSVAPSASEVAAASPSPAPTTVEATPVATSAPTAEPTAAPTPSPEPTATPTPEPTAEPTPEPTPTSDRYALLTACPDTPDCWIYVVRAGDNLYSIARYFGVPEAQVRDMNPWLEDTGLRAGQEMRLPPPTR